jgi:hypothetical protein
MKARCTACKTLYKLPDSWRNEMIVCQKCGSQFLGQGPGIRRLPFFFAFVGSVFLLNFGILLFTKSSSGGAFAVAVILSTVTWRFFMFQSRLVNIGANKSLSFLAFVPFVAFITALWLMATPEHAKRIDVS